MEIALSLDGTEMVLHENLHVACLHYSLSEGAPTRIGIQMSSQGTLPKKMTHKRRIHGAFLSRQETQFDLSHEKIVKDVKNQKEGLTGFLGVPSAGEKLTLEISQEKIVKDVKNQKRKEKYENQNETKNERVNGIPGAFLSGRETQFESGTATRLGMKGESGRWC